LTPSRISACVACAAGLVLHISICVRGEGGVDRVSVFLAAWSLVPYLACLVALLAFKGGGPGMAGALSALAVDALTYHSVFVTPKGSRAALELFFAPLWSTFIVVPAAVFGTAAAIRWRSAKAAP